MSPPSAADLVTALGNGYTQYADLKMRAPDAGVPAMLLEVDRVNESVDVLVAKLREVVVAERPAGSFSRQLFLGETLDTDRIDASYDAGVPRLSIPVAEQAKPRKISITGGERHKQLSS
ncbi:Hsp20/alpha crystallin family protein [Streptomyces lateritius]|uniref:Hsp20/alpha crystallin family protein n=1 Tax=Streptomyces lateritius TaxID=67313 RepID=UPI00199883BF|nr:Hsp20 family protein [Streptomyces lateritius]GGU11915.1 hypothetical protein GCM10010272_66350 [Streptomyces lateritius]